jgi:hypothetical protein
MADNTSATITLLHQPRPMTAAERAKRYRERERAAASRRSSPVAY